MTKWGVFLLSQAMLTVMLLSCALLLALPPTLGVQMGLAPLEGIRRPDQALFPEFPGEYGQVGDVWGNDNCWSQICLCGAKPSSPHPPNPNPNPGRWVLGAWWVWP